MSPCGRPAGRTRRPRPTPPAPLLATSSCRSPAPSRRAPTNWLATCRCPEPCWLPNRRCRPACHGCLFDPVPPDDDNASGGSRVSGVTSLFPRTSTWRERHRPQWRRLHRVYVCRSVIADWNGDGYVLCMDGCMMNSRGCSLAPRPSTTVDARTRSIEMRRTLQGDAGNRQMKGPGLCSSKVAQILTNN